MQKGKKQAKFKIGTKLINIKNMTTTALIMMITVQVLVTVVTGYLFVKVLQTPVKNEE